MAKRNQRVSKSLSLRQTTLERLDETCPDDESVSSWADKLLTEALDKRAFDAVDSSPPAADPLGLEAK